MSYEIQVPLRLSFLHSLPILFQAFFRKDPAKYFLIIWPRPPNFFIPNFLASNFFGINSPRRRLWGLGLSNHSQDSRGYNFFLADTVWCARRPPATAFVWCCIRFSFVGLRRCRFRIKDKDRPEGDDGSPTPGCIDPRTPTPAAPHSFPPRAFPLSPALPVLPDLWANKMAGFQSKVPTAPDTSASVKPLMMLLAIIMCVLYLAQYKIYIVLLYFSIFPVFSSYSF